MGEKTTETHNNSHIQFAKRTPFISEIPLTYRPETVFLPILHLPRFLRFFAGALIVTFGKQDFIALFD